MPRFSTRRSHSLSQSWRSQASGPSLLPLPQGPLLPGEGLRRQGPGVVRGCICGACLPVATAGPWSPPHLGAGLCHVGLHRFAGEPSGPAAPGVPSPHPGPLAKPGDSPGLQAPTALLPPEPAPAPAPGGLDPGLSRLHALAPALAGCPVQGCVQGGPLCWRWVCQAEVKGPQAALYVGRKRHLRLHLQLAPAMGNLQAVLPESARTCGLSFCSRQPCAPPDDSAPSDKGR